MAHQKDLSSSPAQETSQEDLLFPSEEQLEEITGAGFGMTKEMASALLAPKLIRTPSGRVAKTPEDAFRGLEHIRQNAGSNLSGQWIHGVEQKDGTYHMFTHPKIQRASMAIRVPRS